MTSVPQAHAVELGEVVHPDGAVGVEQQKARSGLPPALDEQVVEHVGVGRAHIGRDLQRKLIDDLELLAHALIHQVAAGDVHHRPDHQTKGDADQRHVDQHHLPADGEARLTYR